MWAALLTPLKNLGAWLIGLLVEKIINQIRNYISQKKKESDQGQTTKENVEKLKEAIKEGKSDEEIKKYTENLLNGNKS